MGEPRLRHLAQAAAEVAVVDAAILGQLGTLESPAPIAFLVPAPDGATVGAGEPTLVLDRLQDPGNVGSVLRSAAAFGFTQAIALVGTAALWSPKVVRAGMGAHFGLRLVEGADAAILGELDVPLFGTSSHAGQRLDEVALPWPCAWVFGHEGQGVADGVARRAGPCSPSPSRAAANRSTSPLPPPSACTRRHASTAAERRGGSVTTTMGELSIRPARIRQEDSSRGRASARPLHDSRRLPCDS